MNKSFKKVAFHTLGCKLNYAETSTIARDFREQNYRIVDFSDSADVYVLNTCTVTSNAERKCRKLIRQVQKRNPGAYIAVVGCYAELRSEQIEAIPGVNLILGSAEKFDILKHLNENPMNGVPVIVSSSGEEKIEYHASWSTETRTRSFLKIQDGCDYNCSYCTIPLARGRSRSGSIAEIVAAAHEIAEQGVKEIVLTGVNIGDFGRNRGETLPGLLQQLENVEKLERLRISSIEPNLLNDEILEFMTASTKYCPHFHLPLQSGSNKILKLMKRRYSREVYAERVQAIRQGYPKACIAADVIVGFPGETRADFEDTYNFIRNLDISYLHVFSYSERPMTAALALPGVVNASERAWRSSELRTLSNLKKLAFYRGAIGDNKKVLFEKCRNGVLDGFSDNYIKVRVPGTPHQCNTVADVKLLQWEDDTLTGELIR